MDHQTQARKAQAFRAMHQGFGMLLLPNAWDAGSARVFEQRGFAAIATTSGGMAWSLGYADGEQAPLDEVLGAVARIARCIEVPLSVDMETGYGATPAAVANTVQAVIAAGAVGINLEDGLPGHGPLRDVLDATARIRAAREVADATGVPILINARVDAWMQPGDAARRRAWTTRCDARGRIWPLAPTVSSRSGWATAPRWWRSCRRWPRR